MIQGVAGLNEEKLENFARAEFAANMLILKNTASKTTQIYRLVRKRQHHTLERRNEKYGQSENTGAGMNIQQQLYHEIETLPMDAQDKILKMVHFLKTEILTPVKSKPKKKLMATLADLDSLAVDTGINDLAVQHDHYLYGMPKK